MAKSPDAFRTISEVADWLGVEAHVLRFWETKFTQVKPVKRAGGRRYYRPADMALLGGIRRLLHDDGMTIRGVQKILREKGAGHVSALSPELRLDGAEIAAPPEPRKVEADGAMPAPQPSPETEAPALPFELPDAPPRQEPDAGAADREASDVDGHASDGSLSRRLPPRGTAVDPAAAADVLARARALVERLRTTPE